MIVSVAVHRHFRYKEVFHVLCRRRVHHHHTLVTLRLGLDPVRPEGDARLSHQSPATLTTREQGLSYWGGGGGPREAEGGLTSLELCVRTQQLLVETLVNGEPQKATEIVTISCFDIS